jgi:N-acetyl-gamma-glutamyl-phosphate reductase
MMHKNVSQNLDKKHVPTVSIVGARGYSGLELVRILLNHSGVELKYCFATEAFSLKNYFSNPKINSVECYAQSEILNYKTDIVFLATPAEVSMHLAPQLIEKNKSLVIDVSGAFRLKNNSYAKWYGFDHDQKALLSKAVYGLNPWAAPVAANDNKLIANPGCYATSIMMGLLPLLKSDAIETDSIVVDAKSGTTGGGKKPTENLLYSEVDGECLPYKIGKHQHYPEIQEYLEMFSGKKVDFHFSTSLLSARRGIISSIFAKLKPGVTESDVEKAFSTFYKDQPMIQFGSLKNNPQLASLKKVVGTNNTHISYTVDGNKLYVFSVIDNLVKGAAGQAVENMNKNFDYPVDMGLSQLEALQ